MHTNPTPALGAHTPSCQTHDNVNMGKKKAREFNNVISGGGIRGPLSLSAQEMSANCENPEELTLTRALGWTDLPEGLQAAARGIKFRKAAAFLLNQIIFHSAAALGRVENTLPIRGAFPE